MNLLTHHLQSISDKINYPYIVVWMEDYIDVPIIAVSLYFFLVLYVPENIMKHRPAFNLRGLNMLWNLLLTCFSFVGAIFTLPRLYEILTAPIISGIDPSILDVSTATIPMKRHLVFENNNNNKLLGIEGSLETSICVDHPFIYRRGICGLMCLAFTLSKIPEMIDTVFLVLQKKPLNFLHWYHHITVMLYCWHAYTTTSPSGLWFTAMNYFVHSVMYFYYFLSSCGYGKKIRPVAPLITFLQIAQMIIGTLITIYTFIKYNSPAGCDVQAANNKLAILMYGSYFYLFSQFFVNRYIKKKSKKDMAVVGDKKNTEATSSSKKKD